MLPYLLATKSDKDQGEKSFKECLCSYSRALEAEQKKASVDSPKDTQSVKPGKFLFQLLAQGGGGRGSQDLQTSVRIRQAILKQECVDK